MLRYTYIVLFCFKSARLFLQLSIYVNPQTATRGQIWPQPSFFSDTFFDISYNDTNLRDFVTTGVL